MTPGVRRLGGGGNRRVRSRIVFLKVTANSPAIVHFAKEIVPAQREMLLNL